MNSHYEPHEGLLTYISDRLPIGAEFNIPLITEAETEKLLMKLNVNKATGMDQISPRYLHVAITVMKRHLCKILNTSFTTGIFPALWKQAKVFPVFRNGRTTDINNYRPVSILTTLSKIIESHVHDALYSFLSSHDLISKFQSGFRKFHLCDTGLATLLSEWHQKMDNNLLIGCINIDLRKAFDLLNHNIICEKLKLYGCNNNALSWFCSYLSERNQTVFINSKMSDSLKINHGIPQGSILGPLLFILFINDLPLCLKKGGIHMYADDTSVYVTGKDVNELNTCLNMELEEVSKWCNTNKLVINQLKTNCMLICSPQKRTRLDTHNLNVTMSGIPLQNVEKQTVLGVIIDNSLKFDAQVEHICNKLGKLIHLFNKIQNCLTWECKQMFYNSYFLPCVDYCSTSWGYSSKQNIDRLSRYQKRIGRLMINDPDLPSESLLGTLGWFSINERIKYNTAKLVYKCLFEDAPQNLKNLFHVRNGRELRSTGIDLTVPFPKTESRKKCFDYVGCTIWNSLPINVNQARNFPHFKSLLKTHISSERT